jgi:hypothetical protein
MPTPLADQLCALIDDPAAGTVSGELIAFARRHRLHLVLGDRVAIAELVHERRAAAAVEALREAELRRVLAALVVSGVPVVLLKGAAIARTHYRSPELRQRSDTDILIPARCSQDTAHVLETLGYRRAVETDGELIVSQCHYEFVDRARLSHALDVHWRISNAVAFAEVLSFDEIARDATALPGLGPDAAGPSAVHSLVLACVHRVAHHPGSADLLWLYDVHLLAEALTVAQQRVFLELAAERRVRAVCAFTLADAARTFGGCAGDLAVRLALPPGEVEPTSRFLTPRRRPVDQLSADLRALGRWRHRVQFLREHTFPRREYMFARYGTRRASSLPWLYLKRIVAGAPKWFRPEVELERRRDNVSRTR